MISSPIPILGFAAASGTGKTTLLTQLIPLLKQAGLNVGVIKHSHHDFEIDHAGKDSFRLRKAGASPVLLVSKFRRAAIQEYSPHLEPTLQQQLDWLGSADLDLILVEGFRDTAFPKIELHRAELNRAPLFPNDAHIIAIATDSCAEFQTALPQLDLNNPATIVDFIVQHFLKPKTAHLCDQPPSKLLSLEAALQRLQTTLPTLSACETVPLQQALGRIVGDEAIATMNVPPDANAAMDGYALHSADVVAGRAFTLKQVGTAWAGKPFGKALKSGECVRIFTGAVIPANADSVVMQEQVQARGDDIEFPQDLRPLQNIRAAGSDVEQGQVLLPVGKRISAADLGLLAACGITQVTVKRRLNIAFFTNGDELCAAGQALSIGQIYDSNRPMLAALLSDNAYQTTDLGVIADDAAVLMHTLTTAAQQHDVIICCGGASVGDADYVHQVLAACGEVDFWKIAIKPGKPLAVGRVGDCRFFGLPGNPVAVMVTFDQIVRPALQQITGQPAVAPLRLLARCTTPLKKSAGRKEFKRGVLTQDERGEWQVCSAGGQEAYNLSSLSRANCYIVLDAPSQGVAAGDRVWVEPFIGV